MKKPIFLLLFSIASLAAMAQDKLSFSSFLTPGKQHYPETWFHFVGGNISRPDITLDLEAIAQAGFKGVQLFHGNIGDGTDWPGTQEHIECLSPQWDQLVAHTASEAHRLGLSFTMQTCPGWATSGGPWIKPSQAMRNIVCTQYLFSDTTQLAALAPPTYSPDHDYHDIAFLAFPTPKGADKPTLSQLSFDDAAAALQPADSSSPHVFDFYLHSPAIARTLVLPSLDGMGHWHGPAQYIAVRLTAFVDGQEITVTDTPLPYSNWQDGNDDYPMTVALDDALPRPTSHYRLYLTNRYPISLRWLQLLESAQKSNWSAEAGHTLRTLLRTNDSPSQSPSAYIQSQHIIFDTSLQGLSQALSSTRQPYTVLRIGHVNAMRRNSPAPAVATGWEVDKYNPEAVDFQFNSYMGRLAQGPLNQLLDNMLLDSWECGSQTWTPRMPHEFRSRHGYNLLPWLPALFGYVIDSPETTSRFLNDWRSTLNQLFVNNFYGRMAANAHSLGLKVHYETAAADIFPGDPLEYYKWADVPMCEFWQPFSNFLADHNYKPIRPTASAARMYGKPRVSAEAFTSFELTWDEHLQMLRDVANQNMVEGVSHLVFHTYTHNPGADRFFPGSSFGGGIGSPFLRTQTWWPFMPEFTTYLARCSYMLEAGRPVSQVLWYLGDEIEQKPDQYYPFPEGYSYDYCNHDVLIHRLSVQNGKWVTPEGISYDLLWIPVRGRLLPETVQRLRSLVRQGGVLLADEPLGLATLSASKHQQKRFQQDVKRLWKHPNVHAADAPFDSFAQPDVLASEKGLRWSHRRTEGHDIYFLCTQPESAFHGQVSFPCQGSAELWDPVSGRRSPLATRLVDGRSYAHISLDVAGSLFVVFSHQASISTPQPTVSDTLPLSLPWQLSFPAGWGISQPLTLSELQPWCTLPLGDEGRAFSGTASYTAAFTLDSLDSARRYILSLGQVEMAAEVFVNGTSIQKLWCAPYQTDITSALRQGNNQLEIRVTSTWHNRLAYDAALPASQRKTWVISGPKASAEPKPYGLLGPVSLIVQ